LNFLAHLHLSDPEPQAWIGSLLPDFGDKSDPSNHPPKIHHAIILHRKIDSFTDNHPVFIRSRKRIDDRFRLLKGILVDMFYDHFLAIHWARYHPESLEKFAQSIYGALRENASSLPERLLYASDYMIRENWLVSYREISGIELVLRRMSKRLSRPTILGEGTEALEACYNELEQDFFEFYPELEDFSMREKIVVGER